MTLRPRRRIIGIILLVICGVALLLDALTEEVDGRLVQTGQIGGKSFFSGAIALDVHYAIVDDTQHWPFFAAIASGIAIGLLCVLWPQRRSGLSNKPDGRVKPPPDKPM